MSPLVRVVCLLCALAVPSSVFAQGMLIPSDESVTPLSLTRHQVEFEIADNAAVTHVTQVFRNHTGSQLEATYYFAVPEGAVTTDFALWMNGERIEGEVLPRDEARQTYEAIVRRMRDPGLLEYVDGELFQASIFPIPPHGEQTVEIEFANVLPREGDTLHYRYPIHESASAEIPLLTVSGDIATSHAISSIYSPYHAIEEDIASNGRSATVGMEETGAGVANDFELFIGLAGDDLGFSLITHEADDGEDGYFMLTLAPSPELNELEVLPKQVTFVVDTSGSMSGDKIEQAREMLRYCIERLDERDTFQIVAFSSGVRAAFEEPVTANRSNVRDALAFVDGLSARGNTNISGALERALRDPSSADRPHAILFVTDGLPTEGETDVEDIIAEVRRGVSDGDRRVFSFGVGYDVNTRLLDGMARRGRGEAGYVRPSEDMSDIVGTFYDSIGAPLLTQLELDFGAVDVDDVYPNPLPDLYRGRTVTVFGRFDADRSSAVVVRGRAAGEDYVQEYGASFHDSIGADTSFVGNLWARRRVDELLTEIEEQGQTTRRVDAVVELATEWGIVTPYTSYLALDPSEQLRLADANRRGFEPEMEEDDADFGGRDGFAQQQRRTGGTTSPSADAPPFALGGSLNGAGGSGGARSRAQNAPAPAPMPARTATTGRDAVEASIARNEARSEMVVTGPAGATRRAAGRTFDLTGGIWVQTSAGASVDRRITAMSDEYFALLREHPELSEVFALGERVRFLLDGDTIEIVP